MKTFEPKITENIAEELELMPLTDKKFLGIVHHLFTTTTPNRRIKIQDTAKVLKLIDEAILLRNGKESSYEISEEENLLKKLLMKI